MCVLPHHLSHLGTVCSGHSLPHRFQGSDVGSGVGVVSGGLLGTPVFL